MVGDDDRLVGSVRALPLRLLAERSGLRAGASAAIGLGSAGKWWWVAVTAGAGAVVGPLRRVTRLPEASPPLSPV